MIKVVRFNASKEAVEISGAKDEEIIKMPRLRTWNGFRPVVEIEGKEVTLGYHYYTPEERAAYKAYDKEHRGNGGSGTVSSSKKELDKFAREVLDKCSSLLSKEAKAFFESCKLEDPAIAKARAALKALGLSDADIEKTLAKRS